MENRKINLIKLLTLLVSITLMLQNCQSDEENINPINLENTKNLNLKTVSFQEAQSFFNVEIEKEKRKRYAKRISEPTLELTPNWSSIEHNELYAIDQADLTLADVQVNREGNYTSKLFFINIDDKIESVIFTLFPKEINNDGKIIEASFFYNKLDGEFVDGYKIEQGKLAKRYRLNTDKVVNKAGFLMFFQEKEDHNFWCDGGGGGVIPIDLGTIGSSNVGISTGPTSSSTSVNLNITSVNWYYLGNGNSTGLNYSGGGGTSVTSGAGSLYTHASYEKELAEGEEHIVNKLTNKCAKDIFTELENGIYQSDPIKPEVEILAINTDKLNFSQEILYLFANSKNTNLTIQNGTTTGSNAYTIGANITLNNNYLSNATKLSIVRTMIHESIHAYLNAYYFSYPDFKDKLFRDKLRKYAIDNGYSDMNRFQHEFMGQYVNAIGVSLYEWDKKYGSGKDNNSVTKPDDLLGWNYYRSMAFGGLYYMDSSGNLQETDSFKVLEPIQANRDKIKKILENEQNGNNNAKGDKC
ncbi:hypothetical protein [Tenacibaculum finnmarkense]|uniref:hypothetical protein n=1 Tax=Tenacibaculum finnmarkense TaxID=2781243 RepID=UPI001EFBEFBD|nr:hypothetical protein [Tenacibaculum finnmarkense]MCG8860048.1 hypothetical protein [Tenacibaculum finnmarkense]